MNDESCEANAYLVASCKIPFKIKYMSAPKFTSHNNTFSIRLKWDCIRVFGEYCHTLLDDQHSQYPRTDFDNVY